MHEGGDGKNRETFPRIPDEPSKPRNFSPSKLLSFMVIYTKQPNCKKMLPMQKRQHEKSCEIKGGSPEVAVVV